MTRVTKAGFSVCQRRLSNRAQAEADACDIDNLRYSFDYCVYGYPNGTGSGSNPCATSTACGNLQAALEYDGLSDADSTSNEYGYCNADGGSATGQDYQDCLSCVSASGDTNYIANGTSPEYVDNRDIC